uniref:Uncharacterized protein n=1 Tax=Plectus sambesii TaxID=2011161 RepID=A0A914XM81_9BILA
MQSERVGVARTRIYHRHRGNGTFCVAFDREWPGSAPVSAAAPTDNKRSVDALRTSRETAPAGPTPKRKHPTTTAGDSPTAAIAARRHWSAESAEAGRRPIDALVLDVNSAALAANKCAQRKSLSASNTAQHICEGRLSQYGRATSHRPLAQIRFVPLEQGVDPSQSHSTPDAARHNANTASYPMKRGGRRRDPTETPRRQAQPASPSPKTDRASNALIEKTNPPPCKHVASLDKNSRRGRRYLCQLLIHRGDAQSS